MIYVVNFRDKIPDDVTSINTTSRSNNWTKGFSPFVLKPYCIPNCYNIENLHQFSKVLTIFIKLSEKIRKIMFFK
jgi:dipeptidase